VGQAYLLVMVSRLVAMQVSQNLPPTNPSDLSPEADREG